MGHVLITGGSSGIGLELGRIAIRAGHNVTLVARRPGTLREAADSLANMAADQAAVHTVSADVSRRAQAESAVHAAIARFGAPSHLITCAGAVVPGYFHELPVKTFEQLATVNYLGTLYTLKAAYPSMRAAGSGRIGLVASAAALIGIFGYTAYAPTKYAVRGLGECLRAEARRDGITVTVAYPPDTDTPQLAEENSTKPLETMAITAGSGVWPAADVAQRIWDGMERGRFSVEPGWQMAALASLHSLIGPILRFWFDHIAERAAKRGN
ncbi:MAG: short-chain dehydrogenase [Terriglobia bacterium]|nr:MAG: short-chain dehydrogenase [Terriglobia bacterium]